MFQHSRETFPGNSQSWLYKAIISCLGKSSLLLDQGIRYSGRWWVPESTWKHKLRALALLSSWWGKRTRSSPSKLYSKYLAQLGAQLRENGSSMPCYAIIQTREGKLDHSLISSTSLYLNSFGQGSLFLETTNNTAEVVACPQVPLWSADRNQTGQDWVPWPGCNSLWRSLGFFIQIILQDNKTLHKWDAGSRY